jgi:hypothetical protein
MRNGFSLAIGFLAVALLAETSSAQSYVVTANDVYVRSAAGGFVIGTLYSGDHFRRQQSNGSGSYWGFAGGTAMLCGWVPSGYLNPGGSVSTVCSGSGSTATGQAARQYLLANYAKCVNDYVPGKYYTGGDTGTGVRIVAGLTAHLYGNYDGNSFHHQITTVALDSTAVLAWRWVSDNGEAVLVKLQSPGPWAFMRRDKLPAQLLYSDGNYRTDFQGSGG